MQNQDCTFICEQYTEYREHSLPSEIKAKVESHLAACSSCQEFFQNLDRNIENLHNLPKLKASNNFTSLLLERIEKENQLGAWQKLYHSSYFRVAGYAVAAGLVVALGINLLVDPISPLQPGVNSQYAVEQPEKLQETEAYAEVTDSSLHTNTDTLTQRNDPINSQNQSMQLVSGKK